jgi:hypothetical protein
MSYGKPAAGCCLPHFAQAATRKMRTNVFTLGKLLLQALRGGQAKLVFKISPRDKLRKLFPGRRRGCPAARKSNPFI